MKAGKGGIAVDEPRGLEGPIGVRVLGDGVDQRWRIAGGIAGYKAIDAAVTGVAVLARVLSLAGPPAALGAPPQAVVERA